MNSSDSNHIAIRLALTLGFDSKPGRFAPDGQLRFGATGSGRCLRADAPGEVGSDQSIRARLSSLGGITIEDGDSDRHSQRMLF
jgi:hypothetical protein